MAGNCALFGVRKMKPKKSILYIYPKPTERFSGGITTIGDALTLHGHQFSEGGFVVEWFNSQVIEASDKTKGKVTASNIANSIVLLFSLLIRGRGYSVFHWNTSSGLGALKDLIIMFFLKKWFGKKVHIIAHIHFACFDDFAFQNGYLNWLLVKFLRYGPDGIAVLSKGFRQELSSKANVEKKYIEFIPNFHSIQRKATASFQKRSIDFCFVGSLDQRKGLDLFLKAASEVEGECNIGIVGSFPSSQVEAKYMALAERVQKRHQLSFYGYLEASRVEAIMSNAKCLVLPSRAEGLPLVILEAFASGCLVIAADVGGISEVMLNKQKKFLIPSNDYSSLASCMRSVKGMPVMEFSDISMQNIELSKSYSVESHIESLMNMWKRALRIDSH